jgi:hypothetical protein
MQFSNRFCYSPGMGSANNTSKTLRVSIWTSILCAFGGVLSNFGLFLSCFSLSWDSNVQRCSQVAIDLLKAITVLFWYAGGLSLVVAAYFFALKQSGRKLPSVAFAACVLLIELLFWYSQQVPKASL